MKKLLLCAVATLALGACTQPVTSRHAVTHAAAAQQADLVNSILQLTQQDLATAIQIANVPTPPDTEAIQCATYLSQYVGGAQAKLGAGQGIIPPTGAASAFETVRVGVMRLENGGLSSQEHVALEMACGPLAMSVQVQVAQGLIDYASIGPIGNVLKNLLPLIGSTLP